MSHSTHMVEQLGLTVSVLLTQSKLNTPPFLFPYMTCNRMEPQTVSYGITLYTFPNSQSRAYNAFQSLIKSLHVSD